ncbi:MAG: monovalent cation:H+ antiporter-2, CPA2 family/trk system potassium uptake protein TrkA [Chloroflexi bacterium]|nr:MAG: monovalent cation:H+ antiporter-2, CPA2 family/trk system potassium uptake protein TrkA [Chloroflexota bacterium]
MESEIDFAPLLLVSALAFLIPLVTHRMTRGALPSVVGEILAGVIFGSSVLGIIDENVWLDFLSLFGFAYLMFLAGLEVDVPLLMRPLGRRWMYPRVALRHPLVAGTMLLGLIMGVTAVGVLLINEWGKEDDFPLLFIVLSATAVGVMAPVLKERGGLGGYAQVLLVAGFLVEFVGIVGLGIIAAIDRDGLGVEALLLLALPAVFGVLLFAARQGNTRVPELATLMSELAHASSQIQIRGALALLVIFVVLSQVVGTELVLGAFFAGLALAIISPKHGSSMRVKLDAIGYGFFIPIFFVTSGATLDLSALGEEADAALLIPAFLLIGIVAKVLPGLLVLWPGFGPRRATAGGVLLSANLSLILAAITIAEDSGRFDEATSAALLVLALVSTAAAPLGFNAILPRRKPEERGRAIVVGATETGRYVAMRLYHEGLSVVVIDTDEEALGPLGQAGCSTVVGDARRAEIVALARPEISEVAVVAVADEAISFGIAQALRAAALDLRIVTWRAAPDHRLAELEVDVYLRERATAVALAGAVLRPGLYQALGSEDFGGLEEVTVRNSRMTGIALRDLGLPGGARVILILRGGGLVIPEADTPLQLQDHVTLGGEDEAVATAFQLLSGRRLERLAGAEVPAPVLMPHPPNPAGEPAAAPAAFEPISPEVLEAGDR